MQYRTRIEFEGFPSPGLTLTSSDEEHLVGISPTYLSKIERGDFPPPGEEKIKAIAKELGQDADELLALAGRVAPDLEEIIPANQREMATCVGNSRIRHQRFTRPHDSRVTSAYARLTPDVLENAVERLAESKGRVVKFERKVS